MAMIIRWKPRTRSYRLDHTTWVWFRRHRTPYQRRPLLVQSRTGANRVHPHRQLHRPPRLLTFLRQKRQKSVNTISSVKMPSWPNNGAATRYRNQLPVDRPQMTTKMPAMPQHTRGHDLCRRPRLIPGVLVKPGILLATPRIITVQRTGEHQPLNHRPVLLHRMAMTLNNVGNGRLACTPNISS